LFNNQRILPGSVPLLVRDAESLTVFGRGLEKFAIAGCDEIGTRNPQKSPAMLVRISKTK